MGNLTREPEVRHTPKGTAVGDLSMAINMSYRTADGVEKDEVCYVDVVVWGRQAETCRDYLNKGSAVFVEGRLQFDQWETSDGSKKSKLRVRAERVQFLGARSSGGGGGGNRSGHGGESRSSLRNHEEHDHPRTQSDDDVPHDVHSGGSHRHDMHSEEDEIPF